MTHDPSGDLPRASLDKLAIRGIRAFDDKHTNVIQFQSPVTVIVGTNGTGKTVCAWMEHFSANPWS
jgi:predicted ATPase